MILHRQLAAAQKSGAWPYCADHDSLLMDGQGQQMTPICGCRLDDSGHVSARLLTTHVKAPKAVHSQEADLLEKLGESVLWINLRQRLALALKRPADDGDANAQAQLASLNRLWPGGCAPRTAAFTALERRCRAQGDLIARLLEGLATLGYDVTLLAVEARSYGVELPPELEKEHHDES